MVSSIVPGGGATGANALGVDTRYTRPANREGAPPQTNTQIGAHVGDRVEISAQAWSSARESVRNGLAQVHLALAVGHDAQGTLLKVLELARSGGADAQAELDQLLEGFQQRLEAAIAQGGSLLAGQDINIEAEPGGAPVSVSGVDLRLKQEPTWADVIAVPADADMSKAATLARAAQKSLDALQGAMERLLEAARALEAHQGFLGAIDTNVRTDLNADAARLMALQVRQGLETAGAPIANVEPQAVLSLFRA